MTDGVFYHNHELDTAVMLPEIIDYLKTLDPMRCKPAEVRVIIKKVYKKDLTYAQVAYEISKLRRNETMSEDSSLNKSLVNSPDIKKAESNKSKNINLIHLQLENK